MAENLFLKDPNDVLDYAVDWSAWLTAENDTVSSSSWSVETAGSGLTIDSSSFNSTTKKATAFLSGGNEGGPYRVRNRIITAGGRTKDMSLLIQVVQR